MVWLSALQIYHLTVTDQNMRLKEKPHTEHRIWNLESCCCISLLCNCRRQSLNICTTIKSKGQEWNNYAIGYRQSVRDQYFVNTLTGSAVYNQKESNCCHKMWSHTAWQSLYKPWEGQMYLDPMSVVLWNELWSSNWSRLLILNGKWLLVVTTLYQLWMFTWEIKTHTCCFIMPFPSKLLSSAYLFSPIEKKRKMWKHSSLALTCKAANWQPAPSGLLMCSEAPCYLVNINIEFYTLSSQLEIHTRYCLQPCLSLQKQSPGHVPSLELPLMSFQIYCLLQNGLQLEVDINSLEIWSLCFSHSFWLSLINRLK